jgi:hypothetical protein
MRELEIKRALVEHLVKDAKVEVIATEFPFHFGRRRADLIAVHEGGVVGFEIKSVFDRIDRLPSQLESYRKLFDYVYVVCDKTHLSEVRAKVSPAVGVYICGGNGVRRVRKAKLIKNLDALVTLDAISMVDLRKEFKLTAKSKFELCKKIQSLQSKSVIRALFRKHIVSKYGASTVIFQKEISAIITFDDVFSLGLTSHKLGS